MRRRTFLQLSGMAAASSALAGCRKGNEKLIPFLVPPEDGSTPGVADYYASACRQCPGGCGIVVRVSSGRARKVEGNPLHPVNRGKLCPRGQALVQELYHPDRLRVPLKRSGPRGSGEFAQISWDEALTTIAERLRPLSADQTGKHALLWTPPLQGYQADLVERFGKGFGEGIRHLGWEPLGAEWRRQSLYGHEGRIDYDFENTQYLVSFGADFIENHLSPVRYNRAFGNMRQDRPTIRGRFTYVGPRLSLTAASADRWLPTRPGTEWAVAFAMTKRLIPRADAGGLSAAGINPGELARLVEPFDVSTVAKMTDVRAADIEAAVSELVSLRPALVLGGELLTMHPNGAEALRAVELLNLLLGSINAPGGIFLTRAEETGSGSSLADVHAALGALQQGECELLLLQGGANPAYTLPPGFGFTKALEQVPLVVSSSTFLDDTARWADLILPESANLESWGEVIPPAGTRGPTVGLMQPVVKQLYDTRAFADLLIALARTVGGKAGAAISETSLAEGLQDRHARGNPSRWNELLARGGIFPEKAAPAENIRKITLARPDSPPAAADSEFPLQLQIYPSPVFHDGRGAPLPWLQQLPDPMTTVAWGSWVEINPQTAARLGIAHGDLVEVSSKTGTMHVPAVLYPGIRPEVVAAPIGQGHQGMGRYADGRGVNPMALSTAALGSPAIPLPGMVPVKIRRAGPPGELVTAGHQKGSYRRELLGL